MASSHYGNFRDPVGLLCRMFTGAQAAGADNETSDRPLLLVVGGPRTRYEEFCEDPIGLLEQIGGRIGAEFRPDADPLPDLTPSVTVRLSESDQAILNDEMG